MMCFERACQTCQICWLDVSSNCLLERGVAAGSAHPGIKFSALAGTIFDRHTEGWSRAACAAAVNKQPRMAQCSAQEVLYCCFCISALSR